MGPEPALASPSRRSWLLGASFVPFLWKAVSYGLIGSYLPLVAFLLLAGLVTWGMKWGSPKGRRRAVRAWSLAMIAWGGARLGLMALLRVTGIDEAHLTSQLTVGYALLSAAYVVLGLLLYRQPKVVAARTLP